MLWIAFAKNKKWSRLAKSLVRVVQSFLIDRREQQLRHIARSFEVVQREPASVYRVGIGRGMASHWLFRFKRPPFASSASPSADAGSGAALTPQWLFVAIEENYVDGYSDCVLQLQLCPPGVTNRETSDFDAALLLAHALWLEDDGKRRRKHSQKQQWRSCDNNCR